MGWKGRFGVYTDAETGLMLMGARYYAPCIGRFTSRDPIGFEGGTNLYGYCGGDPVGYVDPLGLTGHWSQAWEFFKGELSCFDPISFAKGIYECDRHILECWIRDRHPLRAYAGIAAGVVDGLQFWNKATPYESGKSFMSCVLLAVPALKKIPSISPAGAAARPMAAAAEAAVSGYRGGATAAGSFSVIDWSRYPRGWPRPTGPFRLLQGERYLTGRTSANKANNSLHQLYPDHQFAVHEVHPVKLGGDPIHPGNKLLLTRGVHEEFNAFWRDIIRNASGR